MISDGNGLGGGWGAGGMRDWYVQDGLGSVRQLVVGYTVQNSYAYRRKGNEFFSFSER